MRYLSVCSGIEAATVAWHPLGWEPAAFSEIEKFPRQVLQHHYPSVPLHGDFTTIKGDEYGSIDLLVGGTPCQSFSIAGLRKGLDDLRGNLMLEYGALARRLGARWLVWENVPGVLSANGGRDFGTFLGMLAELGYGFAYRVLDAQYFGVAQRRRRVFVVGYFGDWRRAAAVLFERHSMSGNPAPSREKGQEVAKCITTGISQRYDSETETMIVHGTQDPCVSNIAFAQGRNNGGENVLVQPIEICGTLNASCAGTNRPAGQGNELDFCVVSNQSQAIVVRRLTPVECERLQGFPEVTKTVIVNLWNHCDLLNKNALVETLCHKLQSNALNVEEGALQSSANFAYQSLNADQAKLSEPVLLSVHIDFVQRLLRVHNQENLILSVSIAENQNWFHPLIQIENFAQLNVSIITWLESAIRAGKVGSHQNINLSSVHLNGSAFVNLCGQEIVELANDVEKFTNTVSECMKFTTLEVGQNSQNCEQLLKTSFSCVVAVISLFIPEITNSKNSYAIKISTTNGYTDINPNGKTTSDGARYKALGNSMAVPVMAWIGKRINMLETLLED